MLRSLTLSLALLMGAGTASAQVVGDSEVIRQLLMDFGLQVESGTDSAGDPKLDSRIDGTRFGVYFYDCKDGGTCQSIQFSAGFDLNNPMDMARVNKWNRERRFGKVYLDDEGDPFIELDINVDYDGVGKKNFDDSIDIWRLVLSEFRDFIDW